MSKNRVSSIDRKGDMELKSPKLELIISRSNLITVFCEPTLRLQFTGFEVKLLDRPYVSHRVMEIQKIFEGEWRYCKGIDNPKDLLT